ncbi:hypothetical protein ILUMI_16604 [Ignelater luminosus]|uniref:Uncharacterized protein n=1 Tax=Ignelater luminosus TaxID=2038154 RepID=A0A8K0CLF5_IGNLU|nr:hypothetical protein ILUMI_16604 [Ignelater luminosus]
MGILESDLSDHMLVVVKVKQRLPIKRRAKKEKRQCRVDPLQNEDVAPDQNPELSKRLGMETDELEPIENE